MTPPTPAAKCGGSQRVMVATGQLPENFNLEEVDCPGCADCTPTLTEQRVRELRDTVAETIRRPSHIPDGEWTQARGIVALCDHWLATHPPRIDYANVPDAILTPHGKELARAQRLRSPPSPAVFTHGLTLTADDIREIAGTGPGTPTPPAAEVVYAPAHDNDNAVHCACEYEITPEGFPGKRLQVCGVHAADAADARRYRWLRHGDNDERVLRIWVGPGKHRDFDSGVDGFWLLREQHLDAAIDAQLAALALANQEKV